MSDLRDLSKGREDCFALVGGIALENLERLLVELCRCHVADVGTQADVVLDVLTGQVDRGWWLIVLQGGAIEFLVNGDPPEDLVHVADFDLVDADAHEAEYKVLSNGVPLVLVEGRGCDVLVVRDV